MSIRLSPIYLWILVLLLGLVCGKLIHTFANPDGLESDQPPLADSGNQTNITSRSFSPITPSARYLWQETVTLRDEDTFADEVERIHRESQSPLRAKSLLSFRIQNSTFEDWEPLIRDGKVRDMEFLRELGEHLAQTDARRAVQLFFHGKYRFQNLDQVYAFRDPMVRTAADTDPEMVLEELKAMRRGGSQMDNSLFFSSHWAWNDPRAAAEHFAELVRLRNMTMGGSPELPDQAFAEIIVKSWLEKDPAEAAEYVDSLPDNPTRQALSEVLQRLSDPE